MADRYEQPSPTRLGTPVHDVTYLRDATFVVLDLETAGGPPTGAGITEIAAVRVCGGKPVGELSTLVNPGTPIPPFITTLTGITDAMVACAPPIERVLPSLLEFLTGAVLVAHNAPFDTGFLRAACDRHGYGWPDLAILDTAALARRILTGDHVPDHRLGTLARHFRTAVRPTHRALDDAHTTVEVLYALLGRLRSFQVLTLDQVTDLLTAVPCATHPKRHLVDGLPATPGAFVLRDRHGRSLHVGTSSCVATRVGGYLTAVGSSSRVSEMIHLTERVDVVECAHALHAEVTALRLVAEHKPLYHRRPVHAPWTPEHHGQRQRSRRRRRGQPHDGQPHRHRRRRGQPRRAAADLAPAADRLLAGIGRLAAKGRFAQARRLEDQLAAWLRAAIGWERRAALTRLTHVAAARPAARGGWELALVRHGRLVAAATTAPDVSPAAALAALAGQAAQAGQAGPDSRSVSNAGTLASAAETERVLAWLEQPGVQVLDCPEGWSSPPAGAAYLTTLLTLLDDSRRHSRPTQHSRPTHDAPQPGPTDWAGSRRQAGRQRAARQPAVRRGGHLGSRRREVGRGTTGHHGRSAADHILGVDQAMPFHERTWSNQELCSPETHQPLRQ